MNVLVVQHVAVEHPGVFGELLREDGATLHTVELDAGEPIPPLAPFDMMLVMGGPQDVWQEAEHPWLVEEKRAIHEFVVGMGRPYLGICLGHQLLAAALGGKVGLAQTPEVGVMSIALTPAGRADPLLRALPDAFVVLQWHSAEVSSLPASATVLASSDACRIQAFRYGRHAYGLQCHVEITKGTIAEWAAIPEYAAALHKLMGQGAVGRLDDAVAGSLPQFRVNAEKLFRNFRALIDSERVIPA